MVPRRRKDKHLPSCMYHRHGRYWYVQGGKWHKLSKELPTALTEYARYVEPPSGGMDALLRMNLSACLKLQNVSGNSG